MSAIKTVTKYEYKGVLYDTLKEANAAFEKARANRQYLMFDEAGEATDNQNKAVFVYIPDTEDAEDFISDCETTNSDYEGITKEDAGLFIYNQWNSRYEYFDCDYYKGMFRILVELGKNK